MIHPTLRIIALQEKINRLHQTLSRPNVGWHGLVAQALQAVTKQLEDELAAAPTVTMLPDWPKYDINFVNLDGQINYVQRQIDTSDYWYIISKLNAKLNQLKSMRDRLHVSVHFLAGFERETDGLICVCGLISQPGKTLAESLGHLNNGRVVREFLFNPAPEPIFYICQVCNQSWPAGAGFGMPADWADEQHECR